MAKNMHKSNIQRWKSVKGNMDHLTLDDRKIIYKKREKKSIERLQRHYIGYYIKC